MVSKQGHGEPNPTWIPVGNEVTRRLAEKIDGVAGGTWGELFNIPLTAHFLGGAAIGDSPEHGVIDPYQRVYNYPTMYVVDGASVSANLGVNPSLSITAQAERAASLWPNKGERGPAAGAGRGLQAAGADRARASRRACRRAGGAAAHPARAERKGQLGWLNAARITGIVIGTMRYGVPRTVIWRHCGPSGRDVRPGRGRDGARVTRPCCRPI